VNPIITHLFT